MNEGTLGGSKKFEWLTPGEVLDYGYMLYVTQAKHYRGTEHRQIAMQEVQEFKSLSAAIGSDDWIFLSGVKKIAVSYANGLARKTVTFNNEITLANKERSNEEKTLRETRFRQLPIKALMKLGPLGILFGIGFELARIAGIFIPERFAAATGQYAPSIILGAIFLFIGNYIAMWWTNLRLKKIDERYNIRVVLAYELQERGRLQELKDHSRQVAFLWKQYVGKELAKDLPTRQFIQEAERRAQEQWRRQELRLRESELARWIFKPVMRAVRRWKKRRMHSK